MSQLFHNFCIIGFKHIGTPVEVHILFIQDSMEKCLSNFSYLNFDTLSSIDVQIVAYQ